MQTVGASGMLAAGGNSTEGLVIDPGPGQYETMVSDFTHRNSGPRISPITVNMPISPGRAAAIVSNPSLQKMSVPSIPSRFMTPVIDANAVEEDDTQDICKMSRLVDDPGKVGPATYFISEDQVKRSPKATINWQNSRSLRSGIQAHKTTLEKVGPGSYDASLQFYKPMQTFIPRSGLRGITSRNNTGTIKSNFEQHDDDGDDDMNLKITPGPGSYSPNTSCMKTQQFRTSQVNQPFQFGTNVKRFTDPPLGCELGPGQYKARDPGQKYNSVLKAAGTATFKTQERHDEHLAPMPIGRPGPGDYLNDANLKSLGARSRQLRHKRAFSFGLKTKRFGKHDTISPGPGAYKA